jgi:hypothetical protein
LTCDCLTIDVEEDRTLILDELVLEAPPECEDGIDNDQDGLVDGSDPGCSVGGISESDDITSVQFRLTASFLGSNRNATCAGVGIPQFAMFAKDLDAAASPADCDDGNDNDGDNLIDGDDPGCALGNAEADELLRTSCRPDPFFFTSELAAGNYELRLVGLGPGSLPATRAQTVAFNLEGRGGFVEAEIDFADADFLEPLRRSSVIPLSFQSAPGSTPHRCESIVGDLVIDALRVTVLDARGEPLSPPILDAEGNPLDGSLIDCPPANLRTETLTWGGYLVDVEAIALVPDPDDPMAAPQEVVCYSTDATNGPEPLAPGDPSFTLVRPEGDVHPACTECVAGMNSPRPCLVGTCEGGVCVE